MEEKTSADVFCSTIQSLFELYEVLKCCICLDVLKNPIILECKHTFCNDCLMSNPINACPLCRKVCNKRKKTPNEAVEKLTNFMNSINEQIRSVTRVDIFSDIKAKKIIQSYNKNVEKKLPKPSTPKPCTFIEKSTVKNPIIIENKLPEPQNVFDVLLESSRNQGQVKKSLRKYKNKKKQQKMETLEDSDKILQFQDEQHKESVVKWLMDSQNEFDRITQTQQGPIKQNYVDDRLSSVSQDFRTDRLLYYHELNEVKRRRAELRRYGSFSKRCRSLDIQVIKPARCRLKRQSISCDSPDFEDNDIVETDIEENTQEVEKRVELIQQIEEECLRTLENNINNQESNMRRSESNTQDGSLIPASGWDRMKKLNENIRKSERLPKQLKIYKASSLKVNGKQNVNIKKSNFSHYNLKSDFSNNPSVYLHNISLSSFENVEKEDSIDNSNHNFIHTKTCSANNLSYNHNTIATQDTQELNKTLSLNQIVSNDNPDNNLNVNLNEFEIFFNKFVCQQSNINSKYNSPEKKEKRKIEKKGFTLGNPISKEVMVSKVSMGGRPCKNNRFEVSENSSNPIQEKVDDCSRSTRSSSTKIYYNKKKVRKSNIDDDLRKENVDKAMILLKDKKSNTGNLHLKTDHYNQGTNLDNKINITGEVFPCTNKTINIEANMSKIEDQSKTENEQEASINNCSEEQLESFNLLQERQIPKNILNFNNNIENESIKKISNSFKVQNIETEQLVKQISASFDILLRENPEIFSTLVRNNTFTNLLQKELEKKLSSTKNLNVKKTSACPKYNTQELIEKSTACVAHVIKEKQKYQDTTSKLIGNQETTYKLDQPIVNETSNKQIELANKKGQITDLNESGDDLLFSMPTQKMHPDQTKEVSVIQRSIQKIQDAVMNISFSSSSSDIESIREEINNVQLYLNNLECQTGQESMHIDSERNLIELNSKIVQNVTENLKHNITLIDNTAILENCKGILKNILTILNNTGDILKEIEENLKTKTNQVIEMTLSGNNKIINTNLKNILKNTMDIFKNIDESFRGDAQQNNGYIYSSYYEQTLKNCNLLLNNNSGILKTSIEILKNIHHNINNDELLFLFEKLLKNNLETLKNFQKILTDNCNNDAHQVKFVESDINILENAYRILSNNEENDGIKKEISNITKLIITKHNDLLTNMRVHSSIQVSPQLISKDTQTDTEKKPLMKSIGVQYKSESTDQNVQTLVIQIKEKAIQTVKEYTDSCIQTDFEDRGFHISSTEAFKTLVLADASVQTADQNAMAILEQSNIVLSPGFDNLEFETQDVNDLNEQNSEKPISQILKNLQNLTQSGTSKAIQRNTSTSKEPNFKNSTFNKTTEPLDILPKKIIDPSQSTLAFNKSFHSNLISLETKNINKDTINKSFNSIGNKFISTINEKEDAPKKLLNPITRKYLNYSDKCSSSKKIRVKSAIPLDIEVSTSNKTASGKSDLVISLDKHDIFSNKEKYKRIRTPSPDSDSDSDNKRFKKMDNRFIRDDISVVFDSETQNKNLDDVSSFGSSGINMDYIDQIWNKIDNGEFGNPNNDAKIHEKTEETPSKKFKSEPGPSKKISTQELLEKCDQHINNFNKKTSSIKHQNKKFKLNMKSELSTSNVDMLRKSSDKSIKDLGDSTDKHNTSVKITETISGHVEEKAVNFNPSSIEKLIDDALLDDLNKPFLYNNKESEDLFVSCLESENNFNVNEALQNGTEMDKAMADFIAPTIDDSDLDFHKANSENSKKRNEINILQNIVLRKPEIESDVTIIPDSDDEIFENEPDVIESTPQKPPNKTPRLEMKSRTELFPIIIEEEEPKEITIPPPAEFQDFFEVNEDDELLAQINADVKENPDNSAVLPITQNFTNSALLSLSPITKEFSNTYLHLNPSPKPNKNIAKQISSTPRSQRQVSIKSFMCKSKNPRKMAEELFGVTEAVRKPCIACSRLNKDQVIAISALTNKKLATYSSIFNSTVTHMIVTTNKSNCVKDHTIKYVNAIAAGIWVLSFKWIQDSLSKNVLLPEEPYEVLDVSGIPGPKEARLFCKTKKLLKGLKIYAAPPFLSTTQADIENIIIRLGGKVVSTPDELLSKGGDICLIITETRSSQDFGQYENWLEALGVVTVDIEWLSHSVGQFKLISLRRFFTLF